MCADPIDKERKKDKGHVIFIKSCSLTLNKLNCNLNMLVCAKMLLLSIKV